MKPELTSAYFEAGDQSRVGTENWWGAVILGREAIYIVQERRAELRMKLMLGLLLLLDRILKRTAPQNEVMGRPYSELPASVRGHRDWPVSKALTCPVVVIPRDQVEVLYHKRGPVELRFMFRGSAVSITHGRIAAKGIRAFLWGAGWPTIGMMID